MSAAVVERLAAVEPERLYRFSVEQYLRMVEAEVLGPDGHVELLEAWIVHKLPRTPAHDATLSRVSRRLSRLVPDEWVLRNQCALLLARSVPEPDLAILYGPDRVYWKRHPRATDTVMVIEVADSSRLRDRQQKGLWYAEGKIPEFWLINLVDCTVEVHTQPKGGATPAYRERHDFHRGEQVSLALAGRELCRLAVSELCPVNV